MRRIYFYLLIVFFGCNHSPSQRVGGTDSSEVNSRQQIEQDSLLKAGHVRSHAVSFESYERVTDPYFKKYLMYFEEKQLPISTDDIVALNIWELIKLPLYQSDISKYLKYNDKYITGPLYMNGQAEDQPPFPVIGEFYPLYKLPTNGDYVSLVYAQVDDDPIAECPGLAFVLFYDLSGHYIQSQINLFDPNTLDLGASINSNLEFQHHFIHNGEDGSTRFAYEGGVFDATETTETSRINPDGHSVFISKTDSAGSFRAGECRFERVD